MASDARPGPVGRPVEGEAWVPPSKSLTLRALSAAALASGRSTIVSPLLAADTMAIVRSLRALGIAVDPLDPSDVAPGASPRAAVSATSPLEPGPAALRVEGGRERLRAPAVALDLRGSGTALRLLTAIATLAPGETRLDGDGSLRARPMGELLEALAQMGGRARSLSGDGRPPVAVRGGSMRGGLVRVAGSPSSQFASALMLVAPLLEGGLSLEVQPPIVSAPYLLLTRHVMRVFGVSAAFVPDPPTGRLAGAAGVQILIGAGQGYEPSSYHVPTDASAAAYAFAAAAVTGGCVRVGGFAPDDPQGDLALLAHLEGMGCVVVRDATGATVTGPRGGRLAPFDLDLGGTPDLAPTLAVLGLFADGRSTLRGVAHLRVKESDRIRAIVTEARRLGGRIQEREDGLAIEPAPLHGARIETWQDHRIAMAFAVAALVVPDVSIADPGCVEKSFPGFWAALDRLVGGP